jgi:diketogulonate reductase-like aldo/keto reductase
VMYNLEERGIEYDLLPWCQERGMPVMAYCPVGQGGRLLRHPGPGEIAARHHASSAPSPRKYGTFVRPRWRFPRAGSVT